MTVFKAASTSAVLSLLTSLKAKLNARSRRPNGREASFPLRVRPFRLAPMKRQSPDRRRPCIEWKGWREEPVSGIDRRAPCPSLRATRLAPPPPPPPPFPPPQRKSTSEHATSLRNRFGRERPRCTGPHGAAAAAGSAGAAAAAEASVLAAGRVGWGGRCGRVGWAATKVFRANAALPPQVLGLLRSRPCKRT